MTGNDTTDLPPQHAALLSEAEAGIARLYARMQGRRDDVIFLVADVDSALGATILGMGVPRHPTRRSVVLPVTRADALRAAGSFMGPGLLEKLDARDGARVLLMVGDSARLVTLTVQ